MAVADARHKPQRRNHQRWCVGVVRGSVVAVVVCDSGWGEVANAVSLARPAHKAPAVAYNDGAVFMLPPEGGGHSRCAHILHVMIRNMNHPQNGSGGRTRLVRCVNRLSRNLAV